MSEENNFDDYNASQITPQYTLLEKFNKVIDWLKGTKKDSAGLKLYKHLVTTNALSAKYIQFYSTDNNGQDDFTAESVVNALKKMVGIGFCSTKYEEYAGNYITFIFKDLPAKDNIEVDGIWGLGIGDGGGISPYNIVNMILNSTIMTHSVIEVE